MGGLGHLKLKCAHLVNLVKMQILIQQVWSGAGVSAFLTHSQVLRLCLASMGTRH